MTIIRTIPESDAEGEVAEFSADDVETLGYVASSTRAMAMNTAAYRAFESLIRSVARRLGLRRYELVTLAAARGAKSRHCRLAHGVKSLRLFDAEQVGRDASAMIAADAQRLRDAGFDDQEIVDIAIAASARVYFASALQALGVEVDRASMLAVPLREALLEGIDRA